MLVVYLPRSVVVEKDAGQQILAVRKNGAHKKGRKEFSSVQGNDDATIFSSSLHFIVRGGFLEWTRRCQSHV